MRKLLFIIFLSSQVFTLDLIAQDLNPYLIFSNPNEKADYYLYLNTSQKIIFEKQKKAEPLKLKLYDQSNLVSDSLSFPVYFQQLIPLGDSCLMITGINRSVYIPITQGKFIVDDVLHINESEKGSRESIFLEEGMYSWKNKRTGTGKTNLVLYFDNTLLVDGLPLAFNNKNPNPMGDQRVLNHLQFVSPTKLIFFQFNTQQVYFVDRQNKEVTFIILPYDKQSVWYYFFDHTSLKHFVIQELLTGDLLIYQYFENVGMRPLAKSLWFPKAIVGESLLIRLEEGNETYSHYLIPIAELDKSNVPSEWIQVREQRYFLK